MGTGSVSNQMSGGMRSKKMKKVAMVLMALVALGACSNTIDGVSRDIKAGAKAVDNAL